jgi:hypothetical protein
MKRRKFLTLFGGAAAVRGQRTKQLFDRPELELVFKRD